MKLMMLCYGFSMYFECALVKCYIMCTDCAVPACPLSQDGCSILYRQEQGATRPRGPS